jgi:transcriptional regulator with XRE-family HTH domain
MNHVFVSVMRTTKARIAPMWEFLSIQVSAVPLTRASARSTLGVVDPRSEIREFLTTRRARITPQEAGLPVFGGTRRVPGLRREEAAMLAGVSVDYYTKMERGNLRGVSEGVLDALARGLKLDEAERVHLFELARAAGPMPRRRRRPAPQRVRPEVQWTLDAITGAAAFVGNERLDILAANELGRALFSELYAAPARPVNHARFVFLHARAEAFYDDWEKAAGETVAILRTAAGRDPSDRDLSDLVGELATQSEAFRTRWAAHDVRFHDAGVKHFHHPVVGEISLSFNRLDLAADHGLTLFTYAAEPGTRSEEALNLLGSWAATADLAEAARTTDPT